MELIDPESGRRFFRKTRKRWNEANQPRELTFSCYLRYQFFSKERACQWFAEALNTARQRYQIQLWAYVLMPEHVHMIVYPKSRPELVSGFLRSLKEQVGRNAVSYLKAKAPHWLNRITCYEGERIRHRFWQPGGGYDRNITNEATLHAMIDYIHNNPVRRGLVCQAEDWEWSSARWYLGMRPVKIELDPIFLD